ncbi:MAG: RNA methyltransferase [Verrucomicrobiales bacterium]|nr:RNA methyltransferase [Verrucomicrobiales bacterium]
MSSELITIEGRWAVEAALQSPFFCVHKVMFEEGRHGGLKDAAVSADVLYEEISREAMADEAGFDFHRGVLAYAARPEAPGFEPGEAGPKRLVVPASLADAGNLGTVIRTAVAFGADGVLLEAGKGADVYSRKAIRASATAVFRLPIYEVDDLAVALGSFREAGGVVLGTSLNEKAAALPSVKAGERTAVLLGAEKDGLSAELESACDELVYLPMASGMDSLNVAATASIVLYELFGRGD